MRSTRRRRPNLHVAQANYRLAVTTAKRWQALAGTVAVSQQEVDVQTAGAEARKAELEAASQNVARYAALEAFKRVVAPFDGVVTARLTDVGSYVNAAGGDVSVRGSSTELFTVADVHALRVFVSVPQDYADQLVPGLTAADPSALATGQSHPGEVPDDGTGVQRQHAHGGDGAHGRQLESCSVAGHVCGRGVSGAVRSEGADDARGGADFPRRRNAGRGRRRQQSSASAQRHARAESGPDGAGHERPVARRQAREQPARRPPGGTDRCSRSRRCRLCRGAAESHRAAGAAAPAGVRRAETGTRPRHEGTVHRTGRCGGSLSGCNLAPVYDPPHYLLPDSYQGSGAFRVAQPQDALSPRGDWWTLFGDEQLNQLEDQLGRENPTLAGRRGSLHPGARPGGRGAVAALSAGRRAGLGVGESRVRASSLQHPHRSRDRRHRTSSRASPPGSRISGARSATARTRRSVLRRRAPRTSRRRA